MMSKIYNFGPGPGMLPLSVLKAAQAAISSYQDESLSILELGHRTPAFLKLMEEAENNFRTLLTIPDDYAVLFLGGATRTQFAMMPMNFIPPNGQAAYYITGTWSQMAYQEAQKLSSVYCIGNGESTGFKELPEQVPCHANTAYLYFTANETIQGLRLPNPPKQRGIPLIADMTSSLLTESITVTDYDCIFAGAQKNIANAGLSLVIIRKAFIESIRAEGLPTMLDFRTHLANHMYATPPTFNCFIAAKMFEWLIDQGGVEAVHTLNKQKSSKLYAFIDQSRCYEAHIKESNIRSLVNVCFDIKPQTLLLSFLKQAKENGLLALAGHPKSGGIRASLYNAMSLEGVEALIDFMYQFEKTALQEGLVN